MKNKIRLINIVILLILALNIFTIKSYADSDKTISIDGIFGGAKDFIEYGQNASSPISVSDMQAQVKPVAGILTAIGSGVLLVCAVVIGMKYIVATPEDQAKLKKQMVGLVVAAVVIFGAYSIWSLAYHFMNEIIK